MTRSAEVEPDQPGAASASERGEPLRQRLARGSAWTFAGYAAGQALRLLSSTILWRLLDAKDFGLMAIVMVFVTGLWMFSDMGIGPSIIQNSRGEDPDYLNTAWTIQILRGLALYVVAAALAFPIAHFYEQPALAAIVPITGLALIFGSASSTRLHTVRRNLAVGRLTLLDLCAHVVGVAVTIGWAIASPSVWALAAGGVATHGCRLVLSHTLLPGVSNRLRWETAAARELSKFARWVLLGSLLAFLVAQADRLIFGKFIPIELLGVYSIAATWATLPNELLNNIFGLVLFPVLSRARSQGSPVAPAFREGRKLGLLTAGFMATCLASGGPALIRFLYDERALPACWIIQLLSIAAWFYALAKATEAVFLAHGQPNLIAGSNSGKLLGMLFTIPAGALLYGFPGAVAGFVASELVRYAFSTIGLYRIGVRTWDHDALLTGAYLGISGIGIAVSEAVRRLFDASSRFVALVEGVAVLLVIGTAWGIIYLRYRAGVQRGTALA